MRWPLELRGARVSVVESAEVRSGDDFAETIFDLLRLRSVAFEGQVAAVHIVIDHVAEQGLQQVPLTERDDVIRAFSAYEPSTRSAYGFCHGDFLALITCSIPIAASFFWNMRP